MFAPSLQGRLSWTLFYAELFRTTCIVIASLSLHLSCSIPKDRVFWNHYAAAGNF
jgi:hypothetical protein